MANAPSEEDVMTFRTLLKHATMALLAAVTVLSFALPADAYYRGRHGYYGHPGHGYYGHRYAGPRYYGARYYGHRYYGPRYYRYGYYRPGYGYYYNRDRTGAAVAAGIIGLTAATVIASQPRNCWVESRRVYLDSGRRVWRNVRVCR
jgi:hypothetical protein